MSFAYMQVLKAKAIKHEDEYHLEEENAEEDEGDDSLSASEDSDVPQRSKRLKVSGRTRRSAKLRSVGKLQDGLGTLIRMSWRNLIAPY